MDGHDRRRTSGAQHNIAHPFEASGSVIGVNTHPRRSTARVVRSQRSLLAAALVLSVALVTGCDRGDGREMREPAVPYVAPTDPPTTSTP